MVGVVALIAIAGWWWYSDGDRVQEHFPEYRGTGIVEPGETLYIGHTFETTGPVEIRSVSVRAFDHTEPLEIDTEVFLVSADEPLPLSTRNLDGLVPESVVGAVVESPGREPDSIPLVMVGVTARDEGAWILNGIELTYRSGFHPERTVVVGPSVCFLVASGLDSAPDDSSEPPPDVDPSHWSFYRSC